MDLTQTSSFGVIAERFRRAGQPEKAITLCREGLAQFPDHLSARVTLGWSLLDMGEYQEAFDQLKSVNKRAPDNLAAIRGLAELHERGIGLVFESMPDAEAELDPELAPLAELDPEVAPQADLDPVMPAFAASAAAEEFDPVMPALAPETAPKLPDVSSQYMSNPLEDLDPIFEPEAPLMMSAGAAGEATLPVPAPQFEIEDVIEAGEPDPMFDLAGLLDAELEPAPQPAAAFLKPLSSFGREPLALRDDSGDDAAGELHDWLHRIRERRFNSVSQLMAG